MSRPFLLGTSSGAAQRYRLLLREDRVELVNLTTTAMEVSRLFFDELEYATVQRGRNWPYLLLTALPALAFASSALYFLLAETGTGRWVGGLSFLLLTLLFLLAFLFVVLRPPYELALRAPGQTITASLPRRNGRRTRILDRLTQAVESYQASREPSPEGP